jgi:hypothetical protein
MMVSTHLSNNTSFTKAPPLFLRHLNAGTLAVVMMVGLAVLEAERGPSSAAGTPAVDRTMVAGLAANASTSGLDTTTRPSGFYGLDQRPTVGPCSGFSRPSVCLP